MNDGSGLRRARFQWQPTLTSHDPANIFTLESAAAGATHTLTGDAALTLGASSQLAAVYAEASASSLTLGATSEQTSTFVRGTPAELVLGTAAAFEFVSAAPPAQPPRGGGGPLRGYIPTRLPRVYEVSGDARAAQLRAAAGLAVSRATIGEVRLAEFGVRSARVYVSVPAPSPLRETDQLLIALTL